jgi:hypothetical protein
MFVLILTKNGWATFWAIYQQTHPVTLTASAILKELGLALRLCCDISRKNMFLRRESKLLTLFLVEI